MRLVIYYLTLVIASSMVGLMAGRLFPEHSVIAAMMGGASVGCLWPFLFRGLWLQK